MTWMQTFTGKKVDFTDPRAEDMEIVDIAKGLSLICRYNGQCSVFYCVADHSIRCMAALREKGYSAEIQMQALMHDAAEAYIGDVVKPLKDMLPEFLRVEERFEEVLFAKYGMPPELDPIVKEMDMIMLATEKRHLMPGPHDWGKWLEDVVPLDPATWVPPRNPSVCMTMFLDCFYRLSGEIAQEADKDE